MNPDEILFETEAAMEKAVDYMTHEFSGVRTGKASPALVENIDVEAYGVQMKLKQLAVISAPEPRMLVIQPLTRIRPRTSSGRSRNRSWGSTPPRKEK